MVTTRWWSESKGGWLVLEEMNDFHLLAAHKKFLRGDYRVPNEPDDKVASRVPHAGEVGHLARQFDSEMKRRQIGSYTPQAPQDEGFA